MTELSPAAQAMGTIQAAFHKVLNSTIGACERRPGTSLNYISLGILCEPVC